MTVQKFQRGDVVHIAADLGPSMWHFQSDQDAVVMGSYADRFGGDNHDSYTLLFLDTGDEVSWYYDSQLTLLRHESEEFIAGIKAEREKRDAQQSELAWIVSNWKAIREAPPGATMNELMRRVGITEPWGNHGEGIVWHRNATWTLNLLDDVLRAGDIAAVEARIILVAAELAQWRTEKARS